MNLRQGVFTALATGALVATSVGVAGAQAPASHKLAGTVTNTSFSITKSTTAKNHTLVDATGTADIAGSATGSIAYTVHVSVNNVSHTGVGTITETATVTASALGTGTVTLTGTVHLAGNNLRVNDLITGGTGAFAGAAGTVKILGTIDVTTGTGSGTYHGHIVL